jgi:hypothetical protein
MLHIECRVLISLRHVWLLGCCHFIVLVVVRMLSFYCICGRLFQMLNRFLSSSSSFYGWRSCVILYMAEETVLLSCLNSSHSCSIKLCMVIGHWFALHALPMCGVRFLSRRWVYLHVAILLTYRCTMLWSSRQVVYTSGYIEFLNKSYNTCSFGSQLNLLRLLINLNCIHTL